MDADITSVRVDRETAKKVAKYAAILQAKKGRFVPAGEAVAEALDKCLAEAV